MDISGGISINFMAPAILMFLTWILCRGVKESTNLNTCLTLTKITIVLLVVVAGSTRVDSSNWKPFAPFGWEQVLATSATVYFSYVGFDAVCNTAEECKNPERDLPIGIMASLLVVATLYIVVCLVVTGHGRYGCVMWLFLSLLLSLSLFASLCLSLFLSVRYGAVH